MSESRRVLAVDVGGTDIKAAIVDCAANALTVRSRSRQPTPRRARGTATAEAVVTTVLNLVDDLTVDQQVDAIGVVVPGVVHDGVGVHSVNLGWRGFPFREAIAEATGRPVAFGHDVRAAGLAEWRLGAARGCRDAVVMPIGTGIASALILDGRLHAGGGYAGEIGHVDIGHGEPCACGRFGCLEAMASAAAVARRYRERSGLAVAGAAEVLRAARAGQPAAVRVWDEAVTALADGILILSTLLGPEVVVLGGGLAMAGDALTDPLNERLRSRTTFQRRPELRLAELGDEAGCLGAAILASRRSEGG